MQAVKARVKDYLIQRMWQGSEAPKILLQDGGERERLIWSNSDT